LRPVHIDAAWSRSLAVGLALTTAAFCFLLFLSLRRTVPTSCVFEPRPAIFSRICGSARDALGLCDGSIWPKTGCASIV
jgi:hypothetical protein